MDTQQFADGRITLWRGDCLVAMAQMPADSIDACVTDPPYHLQSIVDRFGGDNAAPAQFGRDGAYARASAGFMGQQWDGGDIAFRPETWAAVLRVLKPGAHLIAFAATRNYHRMACAIEDAGFEIRDQCAWMFGSGFPKSHDQGEGRGTALKPAWEPICLARKPLSEGTIAANVLRWGTGALNIDGCRVATKDDLNGGRYSDNKVGNDGATYGAGINLRSAKDYEQPLGRWPANVVHDGSDEVVALFPNAVGQQGRAKIGGAKSGSIYGKFAENVSNNPEPRGDSGSAARFFYSAKADDLDRLGSDHPTVKPVDLIQYYCRLVTPSRGIVLDPFAGTGTTGEAAYRQGMSAVLVERETAYQTDIETRMQMLMTGRTGRKHQALKRKQQRAPVSAGPLFGGDE